MKNIRKTILLLLMVTVSLVSCSTEPAQPTQLSPTEVEQTVQAAVEQRMTAAAPTPDIEATVSFRLTAIAADTNRETPTPTDAPTTTPVPSVSTANPDNSDAVSKATNDFISTVLTLVTSIITLIANTVQSITWAQALCCGLPALLGGGTIISKLFDR